MRPRREIEDLIRRHRWPSPSPDLRSRVLFEAPAVGAPRLHTETATTDVVPPPRMWRPSFALLLVCSIIFTFGGCTGADVWAGRSVEAEVARLEARYGSLDKATLVVPPVPAADNRARIARAAAALTVRPTGAESRALNTPGGAVPRHSDLSAFAEANSAAVRLAADIRARGQSNWDVDYRRDGDRPSYMEIRTLSDAIFVTAVIDIEAGRVDEAAVKSTSGLALAASLRQEPELVAQLVRVAMVNRQIKGVQRLITHAEPSRHALDDLARWLAENRAMDPMRLGLLGELKQTHAIFRRMENGDVDRTTAQDLYPQSWPALPESWYGPIARLARPIVRLAHARYLRQMGDLIAVQAGPRPRPAWPEPVAPRRWELADRLLSKFVTGLERVVETGDDFTSELGGAEVAVALRRYRLDHGGYPDDLSALVPAYLATIPIDPYTGRPPIYARQAAGFTLRAQNSRLASHPWFVPDWTVPR